MKRNLLNLGKIPNMKNLIRRIIRTSISQKNPLLLKKKNQKYIPLVNFVDLIVDQKDIPNRSKPIRIQTKIQEIMNPKNLVKVMPANAKNGNNKRRKLQKAVMMAF